MVDITANYDSILNDLDWIIACFPRYLTVETKEMMMNTESHAT